MTIKNWEFGTFVGWAFQGLFFLLLYIYININNI